MIKTLNEQPVTSLVGHTLPLNPHFFSESVVLLQHMIKASSFSGNEDAVADIIYQHLLGYSVKVKRQGNNIWCFNKYYDETKPTILLNSHMDTVVPNEGYTKDPFCPEISEGKLYGLGSNDAGGCVVSLIAAFLHFYSYHGLGFNLCLAITAEEENSGENGIKSILPLLGGCELAIVGEPTLLQMAIAEKGNLVIDCISKGRPGHAAREEGDNAIHKCLRDLEWFSLYQFPQQLKGVAPVKMTVTTIKAGSQHNIVPGRCEFTVDIRHDDTFSQNEIVDIIRRNVSCQVNPRPGSLGASSVSPEHPIVKTGIAVGCKTYISPTTSDQAWLSIPSVMIGPGDSARSHSADEFIYLEEIKKGINLYVRLLETLPLMLINNPNKYKNEIKHINN
ncbi:M20/M25/M40 family metallo-hydrolase [Mucilaginibacter rubeus]|uniref:M20/M25/M40 family metallo-hydrolase n=1 Tax=Mucilaginibacter rubeus TaxID=2027860 RepID=A0A5C1I1W0_9SPHI|nr:M20/M25/M40 family metallo-hydrolase [Mucilaginibacter rubeus]QEM11191.1 M20/M25/M40 family metallo-hydrolase [Mucilaginibacter rubeus]